MKYICSLCGKSFESTHKSSVCNDCKTGICIVCGKAFKRDWPYTQKTCSTKCRGVYRKESGIAKQVAEKSKQTVQERYGVSNVRNIPGHTLKPKKCKYCGKEFIPTSARQLYCKDTHYGPCPVCGNLTEIKDMNIGPQCCSEKCRIARINKTCLEKYGNKDAVNSQHARELSKQHCLEKYGVEYYSQTDKYRESYERTMLERYGATSVLGSPELMQRCKSTLRENFGVDNPVENADILNRMIETKQNKYGGLGFDSPELSQRIRDTNMKRYGVEIPAQNEEIRQKIIDTCIERYGASSYLSSIPRYFKTVIDSTKCSEYLKFKDDPETYIKNNYNLDKLNISILCRDLGVTDTTIYDVLVNHNCSHLIHNKMSSMEYEIIEYLKSIGISNIVHNTKKVIPPLELDVYLPDYNFAIECNPTITHNSSAQDPWRQKPKAPSYHKHKTEKCEEVGVQLFHIFGYEWTYKKDVILSMLSSRLHCSSTPIYGRQTTVCKLSHEDCLKFLDENHRQGSLSSSIRLGLKHNDLTVACMTFSKLRPTLGKTLDKLEDNTYELTRFCNVINTNVVGGASKLFSHFIREYNPAKVVSFSDRAHTSGKLYEILGFKQVSISDPGYVWVNTKDDTYFTRVKCQKRNLPNIFNDVTEDDINNKTEKQIMIEHGFVQVYDSGVIRWEWVNSLTDIH